MSGFAPCPRCRRHVRAELDCPFCRGAAVAIPVAVLALMLAGCNEPKPADPTVPATSASAAPIATDPVPTATATASATATATTTATPSATASATATPTATTKPTVTSRPAMRYGIMPVGRPPNPG